MLLFYYEELCVDADLSHTDKEGRGGEGQGGEREEGRGGKRGRRKRERSSINTQSSIKEKATS